MKRRTLIQFTCLQVLIIVGSMVLSWQGPVRLVGNVLGVLLLYRLKGARTSLRVAQIFLCLQAFSGALQFFLGVFFHADVVGVLDLAYELCFTGQIVSFCIATAEKKKVLPAILGVLAAVKAISHTGYLAGMHLLHTGAVGWTAMGPLYLCTMLSTFAVYILYPCYIFCCGRDGD